MPHVRRQIRNKAVELLLDLPITGTNVFNSRVRPLREVELPALCVYLFEETQRSVGQMLDRIPILTVKISVLEQDGYADVIDDIAAEIEQRLAANWTLGGLVKNVAPREFKVEFSDELQKPLAVAWLSFEAKYITPRGDPTTSL